MRRISSPQNRSPSFDSNNIVNDHIELKEFLEIEKSCQESETLRTTINPDISPYKCTKSTKSKSHKHSLLKQRPDSRNREGYFRPQTATVEKIKQESNLLDKSMKSKIKDQGMLIYVYGFSETKQEC
jgi:hypothetical protein